MSDASGEALVASAKLSELNLAQLGQVFNLVTKQQEALVTKSQALAKSLDEIKVQRQAIQDGIRKYGADLQHLAALIKKREAEREPSGGDPDATVADILPACAEASGVVLTARTKKSKADAQ